VHALKRCKELGLRSVTLTQFPSGGGSPKPEDDRFWAAAIELGMALSPHQRFGDEREPPRLGTAGRCYVNALSGRAATGPNYTIAQLLVAGVLDRFPELRIYFAETNGNWIPSALFFLDDAYRKFSDSYPPDARLKRPPSEYYARHFRFSIVCDPLAIKLREFYPAADLLMWGSDFPHGAGSFPRTREWLDTIFEGAPDGLRRRVLVENPCAFFGLDPYKQLTPTPGALAPAQIG